MWNLIARINKVVNGLIFRVASYYEDRSSQYTFYSLARLGNARVARLLADYEECHVVFANYYGSEVRLGPVVLAVHTEVGDGTPLYGSSIELVLWKLHTRLDYWAGQNELEAWIG